MLHRSVVLRALFALGLLSIVLTVQVAVADAPLNDAFSSATVIVFSDGLFVDYPDLAEATAEDVDPEPALDYCWFDTDLPTVWYQYTPVADQTIEFSVKGAQEDAIALIMRDDLGTLTQQRCATTWHDAYQPMSAGQTYYILVQQLNSWATPGVIPFQAAEMPTSANDDFADAVTVGALPFEYSSDLRGATREDGEPSCVNEWGDSAPVRPSVWFTFTPPTTDTYLINLRREDYPEENVYGWWIAVYTGETLATLEQAFCSYGSGSGALAMRSPVQGTTYHIQILNEEWADQYQALFALDLAPPPTVDFEWYPYEPSIYSDVYFYSYWHDPAYIGADSFAWDFGDGSTSTEDYASHRYAEDGDYEVTFDLVTSDGRSASKTKTISVRTHDVGISMLRVPRVAVAGLSRQIGIGLATWRYDENVDVYLYKSTTYGEALVASFYDILLPVREGSRRPVVTFVNHRYTFTEEDAAIGKVTFRAEVYLKDHEDAFWSDNTAYSLPVRVR